MSKPAEYCDMGLNWFTGCVRGLPCWEFCWARRMAYRLRGRYGYPKDKPFAPTFHEDVFAKPLPRKSKVIALNYMGDWAFAARGDIKRMLQKVAAHPQHTFLTLTKRPLALEGIEFPPNLWFGVSATDKANLWHALKCLPYIDAKHKWISLEPILGDVSFVELYTAFDGLGRPDWVVVGCQSGPRAKESWGRSSGDNDWDVTWWTRRVVMDCRNLGISVWVKQLPMYDPDRERQGKNPYVVTECAADFPDGLRIQETPWDRSKHNAR